jgi:hypothetical protein
LDPAEDSAKSLDLNGNSWLLIWTNRYSPVQKQRGINGKASLASRHGYYLKNGNTTGEPGHPLLHLLLLVLAA